MSPGVRRRSSNFFMASLVGNDKGPQRADGRNSSLNCCRPRQASCYFFPFLLFLLFLLFFATRITPLSRLGPELGQLIVDRERSTYH